MLFNSVGHLIPNFLKDSLDFPVSSAATFCYCIWTTALIPEWKAVHVSVLIRSISHRIPFGFCSLLLKLGELSAVVDGDQQLPDEQANKAQ